MEAETSSPELATVRGIEVVTFSGASDDLIHVDGFEDKYDEVGYYGREYFVLRLGPLAARVLPVFNGTWAFAVALFDEETPMLPIAGLVDRSEVCEYSTGYKLSVPVGTTIEYVGEDS